MMRKVRWRTIKQGSNNISQKSIGRKNQPKTRNNWDHKDDYFPQRVLLNSFILYYILTELVSIIF